MTESNQKEAAIFYVKRGQSGFWDVTEEGLNKILVSFSNLADAKKYVNDISGNGTSFGTVMLK